MRFQDFTIDFKISRKISRFHERFQDFKKDFTRSVRDFSEWRTPREKLSHFSVGQGLQIDPTLREGIYILYYNMSHDHTFGLQKTAGGVASPLPECVGGRNAVHDEGLGNFLMTRFTFLIHKT